MATRRGRNISTNREREREGLKASAIAEMGGGVLNYWEK